MAIRSALPQRPTSRPSHLVAHCGLAILLSLALVPAVDAGVLLDGGCVDDVTGAFFPNRVPTNCTANDVTFVLVGLGTQTDGCVAPGDSLAILLRAEIQNTTAQTRYDIGMYIAQDGDPNNDGATTGVCARASLEPLGTVGQVACPPLDLDGPLFGGDLNASGVADGPYLLAETGGNNSTPDACGDLAAQGNGSGAVCDENADGFYDDSVYDFPVAVPLACRDLEADGFVNIPTCATWGNQADEVHSDAANDETCDSEVELVPGTKAKCRCEDVNSDIPLPSLALSCSCSPTDIIQGETTSCSVTYANNATCVPDPLTAEGFRCGTARYLRFEVDYDEANGTVSNLASARGSRTDNGSAIEWTPASVAGPTLGVIGPNGETDTLTFDYDLDPDAVTDGTIQFNTSSFWANDSGFTTEVQQATLFCNLQISATPVSLAAFSSQRRGDRVSVEWSTASESGTVGFNLYEAGEDGWRRLNDQPLPARGIDSTAPQHYRFAAAGVKGDSLAIEDLTADGSSHMHGPFAVGTSFGARPQPEAIDWEAIRAPQAGRVAAAARGGGADAVELLVEEDGIYRISHESLAAAGFDLSGARADHLALTNSGQAVPLRVGGPARFGAGSYVEFYGTALDTLYTGVNVYTLTVAPGQGVPMATDPAAASGVPASFYLAESRVARQRVYSFGTPGDDPWYDTAMLTYAGPRSWSFDLEVEGYLPGAAPAELWVDYWGSTSWPRDPDHHLAIALNGVPLAEDLFDGRVERSLSLPLPEGLLVEGTNELTVELPGDLGVSFDLINLEGFGVRYPRAFTARGDALAFAGSGASFRVGGLTSGDVVAYRLDGGQPTRLAGVSTLPDGGGFAALVPGSAGAAEYRVTTTDGLLTPGLRAHRSAGNLLRGRADYLVISHRDFLDALAPLVTLHESEGLKVRVVDVDDVYADYGHGIVGPGAISDYIADSAERSGTRYVLLVGGDTYDYRNYLGTGSVSFIPSYYADTGVVVTHAPADPIFGDLDGDGVPELAVGRLPVRTVAELERLIAKTLAYAGKDYPRTAVMAADRVDLQTGVSFVQQSEDFLRGLGAGWSVERAYIDGLGVDGARTRLLTSLDDGVALASFVGHSGPSAWSFLGLFDTGDAAGLTNAAAPAVVLQWGCWNNYYVEPAYETLGDALLLGDGGAAAVLGSATLLQTTSARALSDRLAPLLAQPGMRLGDAVTAAKQQLAAGETGMADALLGWTLLGDPALIVEP